MSRRLIVKALELAAIGLMAILLMACQKAGDDSNLALLDWNGYQYPHY